MPNYNAPGVYIQDETEGSQIIYELSSSIGVLIGQARAGKTNVLQKIHSWTEFIELYANGLNTPFVNSMYLPYAVYGFFQNGGNTLYVGNIKKSGVKATKTGVTSHCIVTAATEGAWGNHLKVTITKNKSWTSSNKLFDVTFSISDKNKITVSAVLVSNIVNKVTSNTKVMNWISGFSLAENTTDLAEDEFTLAGGTEGDTLTDSDYVDALSLLDTVDDATLVAIPGQCSNTVNNGLIDYCNNHGLFPILDMAVGATIDDTIAYRNTVDAFTGVLAYPWGKMTNPLTGKPVTVPTAGHLMGVYARVIETRGVFKVPAGLDATVNGFVEMETALTNAQLEQLNPIGVVCILAKPNAGIVVWGARSLNSSDDTMRYVSDGLLNLMIKKSLYAGTQFAVFEPNEDILWSRLDTACRSFLEDLRSQGALKGTSEEAYYVVVDSTNNTATSIENGELNIEIGYAPIKPAEFIIIKLAHSIQSGT